MAQVKDEPKKKPEYQTGEDYYDKYAKEHGLTIPQAQNLNPAAYDAIQMISELLRDKKYQKLVPPKAVSPLYGYIHLSYQYPMPEQRQLPLVKQWFDERKAAVLEAFGGEGKKNAVNEAVSTLLDAVKAKKGKITGARFSNYGNSLNMDYYYDGIAGGGYYAYDGYYDDDQAYLYQFGDGARSGKFAEYDDSNYYYIENLGGRDQFYRSRKRDRNSYHRRQLLEIEGFGDYTDSLPVILLFVFLMACMCVFGAVFHHRFKRRHR